jgi:phosphoribosylamine--glycine ligase
LIVIGPEKPICDGWADELEKICPVFAPSKGEYMIKRALFLILEASRLEASKSFAKQFMINHNLPTAQFKSFDKKDEALNFVNG